jgi:hypothetical protein
VYVNNAAVADYVICNMTQGRALQSVADAPPATEETASAIAHELVT